MTYLPGGLYRQIEASMPIACVDFLPIRRGSNGKVSQIGLIRRHSPFGEVWCHLGGRIQRGETLGQAIDRHLTDSLAGLTLDMTADPQPDYVYQWFPDDIAPAAADLDAARPLPYGHDPRKHAIGLSFALEAHGEPAVRPGGEALAFAFHAVDALPEPLWPGCAQLFSTLMTAAGSRPRREFR